MTGRGAAEAGGGLPVWIAKPRTESWMHGPATNGASAVCTKRQVNLAKTLRVNFTRKKAITSVAVSGASRPSNSWATESRMKRMLRADRSRRMVVCARLLRAMLTFDNANLSQRFGSFRSRLSDSNVSERPKTGLMFSTATESKTRQKWRCDSAFVSSCQLRRF